MGNNASQLVNRSFERKEVAPCRSTTTASVHCLLDRWETVRCHHPPDAVQVINTRERKSKEKAITDINLRK